MATPCKTLDLGGSTFLHAYEHYLVFLKKREESRSFDVFVCFLGEKYGEKREKKCPKTPKTTPKNPIFGSWSNLGCQGLFIALGTLSKAQRSFQGPRVGLVALQGPLC